MKQQNGAFTLAKRHLCEGITDKDITEHTGVPVLAFRHDDFIYSQKMRRGKELLPHEIGERLQDIAGKLQSRGFSEPQDLAAELVDNYGPACVSPENFIKVSRLQVSEAEGWNPYHIHKRYPFRMGDEGDGQYRWVVVPKPLNLPARQYLKSPQIADLAVILTDPNNEEPNRFWALYTDLPVGRIRRAPDTQKKKLITTLHEIRHVIQISDTDHNYYAELDCDLFPRNIFRKQLPQWGIDPTVHLKEDIYTRYAPILHCPKKYQIAPAIEAIEAGKDFPNSKLVQSTITRICARITQEETGQYQRQQHKAGFARRCDKEPELIYSLLRRCRNNGAFDNNPLALQIVNGVLAANEYFSAGITRNPSVINRSYQVLAA